MIFYKLWHSMLYHMSHINYLINFDDQNGFFCDSHSSRFIRRLWSNCSKEEFLSIASIVIQYKWMLLIICGRQCHRLRKNETKLFISVIKFEELQKMDERMNERIDVHTYILWIWQKKGENEKKRICYCSMKFSPELSSSLKPNVQQAPPRNSRMKIKLCEKYCIWSFFSSPLLVRSFWNQNCSMGEKDLWHITFVVIVQDIFQFHWTKKNIHDTTLRCIGYWVQTGKMNQNKQNGKLFRIFELNCRKCVWIENQWQRYW